MNYKDFLKLIKAGETQTVDYKLECNAFADRGISSNGELAKDICAMSNNGSKASYLVIGVSNDRKTFKSVRNLKLTDDNVQEFCKESIVPPPKVRVHICKWRKASREHANKRFVIIQVGPNRKTAYRLNRNFIDYKQRVCHRRNEIWIRRRAISDLATPEEVASLLRLSRDPVDPKTRTHRQSFSSLSQVEKRKDITRAGLPVLKKLGLQQLFKKDCKGDSRFLFGARGNSSSFWRKDGFSIVLVTLQNCRNSLVQQDLLSLFDSMHVVTSSCLAEWDRLPKPIVRLTRRRVRVIRRLTIVPVLAKVPQSRVGKSLGTARTLTPGEHYCLDSLWDSSSHSIDKPRQKSLHSSTEIVVVDQILSRQEYSERLVESVERALNQKSTIATPRTSVWVM